MDDKNQVKKVEMQVEQIQEMNFALDESIWALSELNRDVLDVQMGFRFQPISEKKIFSVAVRVRYRYPVEKEAKELAMMEVATLFRIVDMNEHIELEGTQFNDKSDIVPLMLNIAIGATRGFLAAKVAGTVLSKYPLPIMDVNEILANISLK